MTGSAVRRLSDVDLRRADLVVSDPMALDGLTSDRPDQSFVPTIIAEYHLPPGAGPVPCSYCDQHQRHRRGLVVEFGEGRRHLIGSTCGPDRLDLHFSTARRQHKELVDRQDYLSRLDEAVARGSSLSAATDAVLFSERLLEMDNAVAAFERAAGDALARLRSLLLRGGVLAETTQVRNRAAEARRDEKLPKDERGGPIYEAYEAPLGPLLGPGFINPGKLRDDVYAFKRALGQVNAAMGQGTDQTATGQLKSLVLNLERAWAEANAAVAVANDAQRFFEGGNLGNLARWAAAHSKDRLEAGTGTLLVTTGNLREAIGPLRSVPLEALPALRDGAWASNPNEKAGHRPKAAKAAAFTPPFAPPAG